MGQTRNISSSGVLFFTDGEPDPGRPIEYVITLNHDATQSVNIRCMGKVLRSHPEPGERPGYQIAATLERYEFIRDVV